MWIVTVSDTDLPVVTQEWPDVSGTRGRKQWPHEFQYEMNAETIRDYLIEVCGFNPDTTQFEETT